MRRKTRSSRGLEAIRKDIADGKIVFNVEDEDIHMGIESRLIQRIGDVGKKSAHLQKPERPVSGGHPVGI